MGEKSVEIIHFFKEILYIKYVYLKTRIMLVTTALCKQDLCSNVSLLGLKPRLHYTCYAFQWRTNTVLRKYLRPSLHKTVYVRR